MNYVQHITHEFEPKEIINTALTVYNAVCDTGCYCNKEGDGENNRQHL